MLLGYGIKKSGPFGSLFRDTQGCCYFLSATNGNRGAEAVKIVAKKVAREGLHIGRYSMPGKRSCQGKDDIHKPVDKRWHLLYIWWGALVFSWLKWLLLTLSYQILPVLTSILAKVQNPILIFWRAFCSPEMGKIRLNVANKAASSHVALPGLAR
jgi:hypothetical protein